MSDTSAVTTIYTNAIRCSPVPEEVILDFGLNTSENPSPTEPIKLTHRVVMNYYTAKRLMLLLMGVVQRHEGMFGVLEVDVAKRIRGVRPGLPQPPKA
jgi:hypothetical protein